MITADVTEVMNQILPREQHLIPVALKRKLQYEGHYMKEIVERIKLEILFEWLKENNIHYIDLVFNGDLIDEFYQDTRKTLDSFEKQMPNITHPEDEIDKNKIEEVPYSKQFPSLLCDKYEQETDDNSYSTKLANRIVEMEKHMNIPTEECSDVETVLTDSEESENEDDVSPIKKRREEACVSVAPGEKGSFKSWGSENFIEEKSFPSIFWEGRNGFIDTIQKSQSKMGFAAYCRYRLRNVDPRFRQDPFYIFFLFITKEKVEIKRSIQTFCRQARMIPGMTGNQVAEIGVENMEKYNRYYSVFKNIRGTSMYFQNMKKNAMSTLRQLGSPTLFFTLSFAEYKSDPLFHQVIETVLNKTISKEEFAGMNFTSTERNKILTENVVQTTVSFERRLQKIIKYLTTKGFKTPTSKKNYHVSNFFYRIEFQAR